MKKILLISSAVAISFSLAGCNTMNDTSNFANSTIGTGVKYTATTVGSGVGFISNTGATVGRGVGYVADTGTGFMNGHHTTYQKTKYRTGTVYRHGHRYMLQNGRYVRMD